MENVDMVAQNLASKLDVISDSFNIAESTLDAVSKHLEENKQQRVQVPQIQIEEPDKHKLIIKMNTLEEDFDEVRTGIKQTIKDAQSLSSSISGTLTFEGEANPEAISAYSNLLNTINQSMKLVMSTYSELMKIQESIKKFDAKQEKEEGKFVNNNFIAINTADLISDKFKDGEKDVVELEQ